MILVVDDEPDIQKVIAATLDMMGHDYSIASNGEEALNKIRRKRYDLVILDIMMPEVNGYEVLEQLRATPSRAETPVIVVTAKHDPSGVRREVEQGVVDHLAKPFLPSELEAMIERALSATDQAVEERRRVLSNEAEVYGSIDELYESVRSSEENPRR
jgi:putative two-component system response regulator